VDLLIKSGRGVLGGDNAFVVPQLAGSVRDLTGTGKNFFFVSGVLMLAAVGLN
jgi:hypothetical protein